MTSNKLWYVNDIVIVLVQATEVSICDVRFDHCEGNEGGNANGAEEAEYENFGCRSLQGTPLQYRIGLPPQQTNH